MKFRNDTDRDVYVFGLHFGVGSEVDYTGTDPDKIAHLVRNMTVIEKTKTVTAPVAFEATDEPVPAEPVAPEVVSQRQSARKVRTYRRKRSE